MPKIIDITGKKVGRWTVLNYVKQNKRHDSVWLCKCDCGNIKEVVGGSLRSGASKSCGCLVVEVSTKKATKHGLKKHPLYCIWKDMRKRCNNPNHQMYKHYGGRGIFVCERWDDFKNFYDDMLNGYEKGLTLEREKVDGEYGPSNCVWATTAVQSRNKRNNIFITIDGIKLIAADWADKMGIPRPTVYDRLRNGWDPQAAILTPSG